MHDETLVQGPQLDGADLTAMTEADLGSLAGVVRIDLTAAEMLFQDGDITREELQWVRSDAERVQNELIRRATDLAAS